MSITNVPFFKPTSIGGCTLWLDGADTSSSSFTYSSGSNISVWKDKSSSANNFSLTSGTTSSINDGGNIVVNFPSGAIMTSASQITFTTSSAFFLVSKVIDTTYFGYVLGFSDIFSGDLAFKYLYGILTGTPASSQSSGAGELGSTTTYVNGHYNPNFGSNYYTNVYAVIDTVAPVGSGTSYLTLSSSFYGRYFVGRIAEFIYYAGGVTSTQRTTIEAYLAQKWGITGRLPTGHPGYTTLQYRSPTFSPIQLQGCSLWLDASDSNTFTGSSTITAWRDKVNGYSFAGTATAASAIGGTNIGCLSFNGTSQYLTFSNSSTIITAPYTVYTVGYQLNNAVGRLVNGIRPGSTDGVLYVGGWSGSVGTAFVGDGGNWNPYPDTAGSTRFGNTVNTWALTCCTVSNTASQSILNSYFNGATQAVQTGSILASSLGGMNIGGGVGITASSGQQWYGYIGEVIFYNSVLSVSQRQQVEAYLSQKWGLSSTLSSDHLGATSVAFKSSLPLLTPIPFTSLPYAFAPTQITGCSLWLDGADPAGTGVVPAIGAAITTWADKSGLGNTATNQGSQGTVTFTAAGLVFNGYGYFYMPSLAGNLVNKAFVIFMVETLNTTGGTMLIGDDAQTNYGTNNVLHIMYRSSTNHTFAFYANDLENTNVSGTGTRRLWTFWLPTASNRVTRRNGAVDVTHSNYDRLNYWSTPAIGRGFGGYNYVGTMSEVIIYPSDIGITNIQKVEAYLAQKWGLKSSLGANHVGLTTDYYNSQSILSRAAITIPPRLAKIPLILSGLTNRWTLNEGTGSVFYDSVAGQTGTLIGATSWVSAANTRLPSLTNAIYFANTSGNGNSQYGQIVSGGISINTLTTANWSISLWFKPLTFVAQGADVYFSINSPTTRYWNFYIGNGSGNLYNYSGSGAGGSTSISGTVATNAWSHIVYTCSSSSITVYVNGSSAGSGTWPSFSFPANTYLTIGIENISSGFLQYGTNMYMQDVRIYNRPLSATEVTAIYNTLG